MPFLPIAWTIMSNPIAIVIVVAIASFGYGHHRATVACNERIAGEHARALQIHAMELERQAKAAEAISFADRNREAVAGKAADAMQGEIDALKKDAAHAKDGDCRIDGTYARRVQRLDRSGRH